MCESSAPRGREQGQRWGGEGKLKTGLVTGWSPSRGTK